MAKIPCRECVGKKVVYCNCVIDKKDLKPDPNCPTCGGTGKHNCPACNGTGEEEE